MVGSSGEIDEVNENSSRVSGSRPGLGGGAYLGK